MVAPRLAVPVDAKLSSSQAKQVGLSWPLAVDAVLDTLVDLAEGAGERTDRKELLAAFVATCELDGEQLGLVLRRYRLMRVRDVMAEPIAGDGGAVVELVQRRPGRRSR